MEDEGQERQLNIHLDPENLAGVYANFANVSFSDYEFTLTFARIDHEVDEGDVPGVVVSRVNMSPRFMRELLDAMNDSWSKWSTREGIRNLPEQSEDASDLCGHVRGLTPDVSEKDDGTTRNPVESRAEGPRGRCGRSRPPIPRQRVTLRLCSTAGQPSTFRGQEGHDRGQTPAMAEADQGHASALLRLGHRDALHGRRVRPEPDRHPGRRVGIGQARRDEAALEPDEGGRVVGRLDAQPVGLRLVAA